VTAMVFGDLFLTDIRAYREQALAGTGIEPVFPLWGRPTAELGREMLARGIRAVLTCVDPGQLDGAFAGRPYDEALLADLPAGVDPCGENGEFHTFVHDGPGFRAPIEVRAGEIVERDGFVFADVVPR
jgi:diphthamide synthase (EF-2-diphthine--ammonia ligase)